jgi:TRAP transporter TAXI family solute receptor
MSVLTRSLAVAGLAAAVAFAVPAGAQTVAISTLPPGAINNVQAQALARVVQDNAGLQMRVLTFNAAQAIVGAVQTRQAEFAFTSNDEVGVAVTGRDEYEGRRMGDLRMAATLLPFSVGIFVRADSDIRTVADLKGKRFATGWDGFRQGIALSNAVLASAGLSLNDVVGVPGTNLIRAADDFKAGKTDGAVFAVGAPKVAEINAAFPVRFIPMDTSPAAVARVSAVREQYGVSVVNPSPALVGISEPTPLLAYNIVLVVHKDVSDDVVYRTVKALHAHKDALAAGHPSFGGMNPADMGKPQPGLTYHPGAVRFYREAGIWKD